MKLIVCLAFMFSVLVSLSQYEYSPGCVKAHTDISALRFNDAIEVIENEKLEHPHNLIPFLLESYMDFLTLIIGEHEHDLDRLSDRRADVMEMLSKGDQSSPWYRSSIARVNLQWAFARVKFGSYLNAALDIRKAYLLLHENQKEYPGFLPDKLGLGVLHALIGSIPDNYRWIANIFAMNGSVEQGRSEIIEVLTRADEENFPYLRDEALFFLSFIDLNLQPEKDQATDLLQYYPDDMKNNPLLVYSASRILMQAGQTDKAADLLEARPRNDDYYPFYYLDYLQGICKLNSLDTPARYHFIRFTANFKGKSYIKSAYQRLAWCAFLEGDTLEYYMNMEKVLRYGDNLTDGDKIALQAAVSGDMPNLCLLKARLLYDGGFYPKADSVMMGVCPLHNKKDSVEYLYRKGRIEHAMGNAHQALQWYAATMKEGAGLPYYFAANAALQSGTIYESAANIGQANDCYERCIRMPKKEYETSLNQKARAGLNRLKEKNKNKK